MPESSRENPPDHVPAPPPELAAARETLDVPEWVSEMRRLYVEPKTRARLREEGAIPPQKKRQRGLPGVRSKRSPDPTPAPPAAAPPGPPVLTTPGARRADPQPAAPALPASPGAPAEPLTVASLSGPAEPGAPAGPVGPTPALPGSTAPPPTPPEPQDEPLAGSATERGMSPWLTSYLSGAEHDTEDEARAAGEHQTDPPSRSLAELAGSAETVEPLGEAPVEAGTAPLDEERRSPLPGRPETVPAVTLSWREAEVFDVSIPEVESRDRAIVVEPPSQVVAQSRSRRRPLDAGPQIEGGVAGGVPGDVPGDDRAVAPTVAPAVDSAPSVPDAPLPTRAAARAASGNRSGKRRRILVVGLALVMVVVVAGYFLLAHGVAVASAR